MEASSVGGVFEDVVKKEMIIVLLGPPGSGKGTQAAYLKQYLKIPHIATGDILREAVKNSLPLGVKAQEYMKQGALVPDELIIEMMAHRLEKPDCQKGFILDGFPRSEVQAKAFDQTLAEKGWTISKTINLTVHKQLLIERLSGRRTCGKCGTNYHIKYNPPKKMNLCDLCDGELYQREDDKTETIDRRLNVYQQQTAPLIKYYQDRLTNISGDQPKEEIGRVILAKSNDKI